MKKITLFFLVCVTFITQGVSQTLNQNASWPNGAWTITGTFNSAPEAFEADPTVVSNFAFDDDDAGSSSDDDIAAESPIIDLTAAFGVGETWLRVSADYVYRYLANDELIFQYWDADGGTWMNWGSSFDTLGTTTSLANDFCSGTSETFISDPLDIASFTATQLSGFRYRISYDDDPTGGDWNYGFCFQSPTISSETPPNCLEPENLDAEPLTVTTADLSWTPAGTENVFDVEIVDITAGGTPTGTPTAVGLSTSYSATGLSEGNDYDFYVRADCGGGDVSTWAGPFSWNQVVPPSNDECENAIALTVNTDLNCGVVTAGSTVGATASPQADDVSGTPNTDVWFSFVATNSDHTVELQNVVNQGGGTSTSTDMGMGVYDATGGCAGLVFSATSDPNTLNLTGLSIGTTYLVRVYGWFSSIQFNNFDICVGTPPPPPPPPANDECDNAIGLTVNPDYNDGVVTAGTTEGATASAQADDVSGTPNTDVWFSFQATQEEHRVSLLNVVNLGGGTSSSTDMGMGVYDGTNGCSSLVFVATSDPNTLDLTNLTIGTTYLVRVYGWFSSIQYNSFDISIGTDEALSLNEFDNGLSFSYYPNPVKNTLTLNAQNTIDNVVMYNMLGQEVLKAAPNAMNSDIDMSNLQNGTYFVKVFIGDSTKTIKVIKH